MKYTPFGIKNQEFNKSVRGYDKDEVKAFLEKLADEFERIQNENDKLKSDVDSYEEQLKEFRKIEKNLQTAFLSVTESSNKAVDSTKKQTALMIKEAELKVLQMIEKAKENANSIRDSVLNLREERKLLIARLKAMIETQASVLEFNVESANTIKSHREQPKLNVGLEEQTDINVNDILEKLL
jgi:cell division initiation protein